MNQPRIFSILLILTVIISYSYAQDTTQVATPAQPQEQSEATKPEKAVQQKQKAPLKDKIYYGGNIRASINFNYYTMIGFDPYIAYKLTPKLSTGVKFIYQYIIDDRYDETYTSSNYGGSVFARYRLIPALYAHAEYAQMSYENYNALGESKRVWVPFFYVGGGYSKSIGPRTWLNVQVLFDVIQDSNSPYNQWDPFISVGVGVGF